ncbi:hypothetical protein Aab01nite_85400 [Paractinoplanes abujensis]|uniref:Uncharacterized protein n=1 Tax=Paractinoplanes abujensis TaxID=882441 RepID=A0A7W7G1Y3_9ACTN|nr:hypothetical protein [Actinoplanes abujensis]MBB4693144.1 hypothetical protein [Actinoplanes abujensis]GID24950.1 hypothetical protein Aab01nite_85400 [Actinoplanes abujensis]
MSERSTRRTRPPHTVMAACVLIGIACVLFFVTLVRDDDLQGAGYVIGSLLICSAVGYSFVVKLLQRSRGIAWLVMAVAAVQVLAAPAEWQYQHTISADGVLRALVGGTIAVLLALPPSRAWFRPRTTAS